MRHSRTPAIAIAVGGLMVVAAYLLATPQASPLIEDALRGFLGLIAESWEIGLVVLVCAILVLVAGVVRRAYSKRGLHMDREIRNKVWHLGIAIVSVLAVATLVSGYTVDGDFTISQVSIDSTQYGGEDYTNWTHGTVCLGWTYDAGIRMVSGVDLTSVKLQLRFIAENISASEISVWYWSGSEWSAVIFEADAGVLIGSFTIPGGSLTADTPIVVPLLVVFNEIGSYKSQIWAEGVQ